MFLKEIAPYLVLAAVLVAAELLYFYIAVRFRIIDKPNERSSHQKPVIRGGGVIFIISLWAWFIYQGLAWPWFLLGVSAVAVVSFIDDVASQPSLVRFMVHLAAMLLVFHQLSLFEWHVALVLLALVVCIGALNAFNFMDGINGITGIYALVCLLTFLYINKYVVQSFTFESFLLANVIAVLVFLFFNFRKRARCFAGDVGSVTLAFVQVFLLLQLIFQTGNFAWVLLFLVFGVDSVVTIVYRLRNRENIFKAHRTHLYQYMSNELKVPHLRVSVLYGVIQLLVNVLVIRYCTELNAFTITLLLAYAASYTIIRELTLKRLHRPGFFSKAAVVNK